MIITALIENRAGGGLLCEHGLAVHIQYGNKNYLLDTGASGRFIKNAAALGISLKNVDATVLSHAHYDHSGGYREFFAINDSAEVYIREAAKDRYYSKVIGPFKKDIGIPGNVLDRYSQRFVCVSGNVEISEGVHLLGFDDPAAEAGKTAHMYRKRKGKLEPDTFKHEQSLVFETRDGIVILNSCCHNGVCYVVEMAKAVFPGKRVLALIGGFHLMGFWGAKTMAGNREKIAAIAARLDHLGVERIYTGHCTGDPAYEILQEELGKKAEYFMTGCQLEI